MTENLADRLPDLLPRIRAEVASVAGPHEADDVAQECCVRLIEKEHLWRPERGSLAAWGTRVARRVALNWKRRREREPVAVGNADQETKMLPEGARDRIRWIVDQFTRLPARDRTVLRLRYLEEKSTVEMAEALGVSQPAVSRRLSGALGRLQRRARAEGLLAAVLPVAWAKVIAGAPKAAAAAGGVFLVGVASACAFWFTEPGTHLVADTVELKHTTLTAPLDAPLDPERNLVWCAAAPLAWAELKKLIGGDAAIPDGPPWIAALNRSPVGADDVDSRAWVAGAGRAGSGFTERLQKRLQSTFGRGRDPALDGLVAGLPPDSLVAYAFLSKELHFPTAFDRLDEPIRFRTAGAREGEPFRARAFGIKKFDTARPRHRELKNQLRLHDYRNPKDFVVVLETREGRDEVVLARIPPEATLRGTADAALARIAAHPAERLAHDDQFRAPVFDFHLTHRYRDLEGKRLANPGFEGNPVAGALQTVRFRLDEEGVTLRSRYFVGVASRAGPVALIFDGPFLMVLREKDAANPYFAMWVAHPELLVPFE